MAHSFSRVIVHVVWATRSRTRWIDASFEGVIRDAVAAQADRLGSPPLAFGTSDDHAHVVVDLRRALALSTLVRALKGASGHEANRARCEIGFRWQKGYGAFSVSERDPDEALDYVRRQRERHAIGDLRSEWERVDEAEEEGL